MKNRKGAERQASEGAPLTFCDVVARFSEDEWKLLRLWQKELYNNVMKEIHQTLTSLGPLIATSVFSLGPKEKEDVYVEDLHKLEIRGSFGTSSKDVAAQSDMLFSGNQDRKHSQEKDGKESHDDPSSGDCILNFDSVKRLEEDSESGLTENDGAKVGESSLGPIVGFPSLKTEDDSSLSDYQNAEIKEVIVCHTSGPEDTTSVVSFGINEEGETYPIEVQDYPRKKTGTRSAGNGNMNRKKNIRNSLQINKSRLLKSASKKLKTNVLRRMRTGTNVESQQGAGSDSQRRGVEIVQWQRSSNQLTHSELYSRSLQAPRSEARNKSDSMIRNDNITLPETNPGQSGRNYTYTENEPTRLNNIRIEPEYAPKVKGIFTCTQCGKIFNALSKILSHERIHTGERPFHCSLCGKNFSQKGAVLRHQKMHTGARPYQCSICEKRFNQMCHLRRHQKTHSLTEQQ